MRCRPGFRKMDTRIGKQLTQTREAMGLVVEDVAHRTKIPASTIRFLESEDYSHFPNNVYAKGFLRLYCKFLGIDPRPYLAEKDEQLITHEDEVAFLEGIAVSSEFQDLEEEQPERKVSNGTLATAALFVIGIPVAFAISKMYGDDGEGTPAPPDQTQNQGGTREPEEPGSSLASRGDPGSVGPSGEALSPTKKEFGSDISPPVAPPAEPVEPGSSSAPRATPADPAAPGVTAGGPVATTVPEVISSVD